MTTETTTFHVSPAPEALSAPTDSAPRDVIAPSSSRTRFGHLLLPALLTALVIATGMAYSLWWPAVVHNQGFVWAVPGDFWSTWRQAHFVAWGFLSDVY